MLDGAEAALTAPLALTERTTKRCSLVLMPAFWIRAALHVVVVVSEASPLTVEDDEGTATKRPATDDAEVGDENEGDY